MDEKVVARLLFVLLTRCRDKAPVNVAVVVSVNRKLLDMECSRPQ